jgi:creatinine amidohydrolase/Fe(II)-dependent formamide hydrolase-like protein
VSGDPTLASTEYGAKELQLKVEVTVNRVRALIAER